MPVFGSPMITCWGSRLNPNGRSDSSSSQSPMFSSSRSLYIGLLSVASVTVSWALFVLSLASDGVFGVTE